jgi:ribosomal subunit interface protein
MDVIISGRHYTVDETLKSFAEGKFQQLAVEFPKLTSVRVVMHMERGWNVVEAHLHGKLLSLEARGQSRDMAASVEEAVGKLETQLRKHLEKIKHHKGGTSMHAVAPAAPGDVDVEEEDDDDEVEI